MRWCALAVSRAQRMVVFDFLATAHHLDDIIVAKTVRLSAFGEMATATRGFATANMGWRKRTGSGLHGLRHATTETYNTTT